MTALVSAASDWPPCACWPSAPSKAPEVPCRARASQRGRAASEGSRWASRTGLGIEWHVSVAGENGVLLVARRGAGRAIS
eukprot:5301044-Prymnesium_polylepis.1